MKKNSKVFAYIQGLEDQIINRFCSVTRRLERKMDWFGDGTAYVEIEPQILEEIRFYEDRGYYLFQEPWIEHEPFNDRFRVVLTFRPTENNQ